MRSKEVIQQLIQQISQLLPPGAQSLHADFETKTRHILENTFRKFELVTREEFDIQCQVLLKTRKKLEHLEQQLADLEKTLDR